MKLVRISAIALLVLAAAAVAGVGRPEAAQGLAADQTQTGITVNGMGSVETTPDIADLGFGVVTQAQTARAALTANAAEARKIVAALRTAGIAAKDIQTQQTSLEPRYADSNQSIRGYTATTSVSVVLRDLAKAADTIDAAVTAGANSVYGPALRSSKADQLYRDALKAAVADARVKAKQLADAAGVVLGNVTAIVESGAPVPMDAKTQAGTVAGAPSIEPGTQHVVASVTVTFAIR
jgi:uncharacterized protein YggE